MKNLVLRSKQLKRLCLWCSIHHLIIWKKWRESVNVTVTEGPKTIWKMGAFNRFTYKNLNTGNFDCFNFQNIR